MIRRLLPLLLGLLLVPVAARGADTPLRVAARLEAGARSDLFPWTSIGCARKPGKPARTAR